MTLREVLIGLGIFLWVFGYIRVGHKMKTGGAIGKSFVRAPFFVYLICAMPKAKNIPPGVMASTALMAQLIGILWGTYGVLYSYLPFESINYQLALVSIGQILIYAYGLRLYKKNLYEVD